MSFFYITGCARSGTTLLQFMMDAFENLDVIPGEQFIDQFTNPEIQDRARKNHVLMKRDLLCLTGNYPEGLDITDEQQLADYRIKFLDLIRSLDLQLIDIIRDPRDVITSTHHADPDRYWVDFERWYMQYVEINWFMEQWDKIIRVQYENLLRNPDRVQNRIANVYELNSEFSFSDFPDYVNPDDLSEKQQKDIKGLRKPDPEHIGRWTQKDPERVFHVARQYDELTDSLIQLGYEENENRMDNYEQS
ncbi:MAG: sulfotransferase [bacterium]